jgi:shikimate dehydrogenase
MPSSGQSRECSTASPAESKLPPSRLVILGDPVSQSLSPLFQNAALRAAGIDVSYEAVRVLAKDLPAVARELAVQNAGGNVTAPHKIAFLGLCDEVSPIASRVGAVNTFWASDGKIFGDNTDVGGFDAAVREIIGSPPDDVEVAIIGAGGAAAAVLGAIERWPGAKARLHSRTPGRASALALRFGDFVRVESSIPDALQGARLVVNATPVGMTDDSMPFDPAGAGRGAAIFDLVYKRGGTALTRAAAGAGFRAADGITMLIEQGAIAFERWFGFNPDKDAMRAALG